MMRGLFVLTTLAALAVAVPSYAQTEGEIATRRLLLERAEQARTAGDHAHALEYAIDAGHISMSPSLRVFLAEEHSAVGQFAEALGAADECAREAQHDPNLHNRDSILARCHQLASEARMHVGSIVVRVAAPYPSGLRVVVNGVSVAESLLGIPYAVTSGSVVVEASAPGHASVRQSTTVAPGANAELDLTLPATPTVASESPPSSSRPPEIETRTPAATTSPPSSAPPVSAPTAVVARQGAHVGTGPIVLIGAAAVLFGGAGLFYFLQSQATPSCRSGTDAMGAALFCPPSAMSEVSTMQTYNLLTNVALGVGAAALIAGGVWLVLDLRSGGEQRTVAVDLAPLRDGAVITARGRF